MMESAAELSSCGGDAETNPPQREPDRGTVVEEEGENRPCSNQRIIGAEELKFIKTEMDRNVEWNV